MLKEVVVGIDIGGTNTDFGFVDENGKILLRSHHNTTDYPTFDSFVESIYAEVVRLEKENDLKIVGIGIGAPNGNYYNGTIEYAPNLKWKGVIDVVSEFKNVFDIPTFVTNDANAATLGEMLFGGAKGMNDFIYITLGTGVGSGIVINGNLVYGHDGFAGEIGHIIAEENGRKCGCGRLGCLETYSSVTGLLKSIEIYKNNFQYSILNTIKKDDITGKTVYEAALKGDALANKAFDIAANKLGKVLANVVAITSPESIFLFGGLAKAGDLIFSSTKKYMENNLLNIYKNKVKILPSLLKGNEAAIKGAAALAWNEI
jgi:glucokinase